MSIAKSFASRKQWVRSVQSELAPLNWSGICHIDPNAAMEANTKVHAERILIRKMQSMTDDKEFNY